MLAIWAGQIILLFVGPEMTEEERDEYAATADDLETLRKQGVSLKEIGAQRARMAQKGGQMDDTNVDPEKPATDIEHLEAEKGASPLP